MEKALTMFEVARALRCSIPTAYQTVRSGRLPAARGGKLWRVSESAVNSFLRGSMGGGAESKSQAPRASA